MHTKIRKDIITLEARTRKLTDGSWVAEVRTRLWFICGTWRAVDIDDPRFAWEPDEGLYEHCHTDSEDKAQDALKHHLARRYGI